MPGKKQRKAKVNVDDATFFNGSVEDVYIEFESNDEVVKQKIKNPKIDDFNISGSNWGFSDRVSIRRAKVVEHALLVTEENEGEKIHNGEPTGLRPDLDPGMIWIADRELRYVDSSQIERHVDSYDEFTIRDEYVDDVKSEYVCQWNET